MTQSNTTPADPIREALADLVAAADAYSAAHQDDKPRRAYRLGSAWAKARLALAQRQEQLTRSQRMREAGYTPRESITGAGGLVREKFRDAGDEQPATSTEQEQRHE